jgi:DNA primase
MSFPPAFLEELRTRLSVSEIIGKRIKITRSGREYKACCPFHNEKTPSFYINDDKQFYHCFGCGAHGDIIGFTMRHDHLSFPEAIEALAGQAGLAVPRDTPIEREQFDKEKRLYQLLDSATKWFEEQLFAPAGRMARSYIGNRGLSEDAIRRFRLGYAPSDSQALIKKLIGESYKMEELVAVGLAKKSEDRNEYYSFFRNRLIFPVGDRKGRTVAFGGRVLDDGEPKYLNSPDHALFHKGKLLYGLSRARAAIAQNQSIIVVEGYMDVIALVEAGFSGAVAPLGTALTEDQLMALWKLLPPADARDPSRDYSPILCFDGDNAGLRAAGRSIERVLPLLTPSQTIRIATMTGAKDPDDLIRTQGKSAMDALLQQAKPMCDALWDMTLAGRRLQTPEDRAAFSTALKQKVLRIGNEQLRLLYQDEIKKRLATAFGWQGDAKQGDRHMDRRPGWKAPVPPPVMLARRQPPNARHLRERALLALMINHPALFADFGEDIAHIGFSEPVLELLRQRIVDILSLETQETLDAAGLYRHLSGAETAEVTNRAQAGLAEVLSDTTYMHVGFARPDRPLTEARTGWKSIWNKYLQEKLLIDLQTAKLRYAENASDENLSRVMALQQQVMHHETVETNVAETAPMDAAPLLQNQEH